MKVFKVKENKIKVKSNKKKMYEVADELIECAVINSVEYANTGNMLFN